MGPTSGGSGIWDTTLSRWATAPGGSSYTPFAAGDTGVFGGTGGLVAIAAPINGSIDVQSDGYLFWLTGGSLTWGGASTFNVAPGITAQLRSAAGGTTLNKTGAGTLVFDTALMTNGGVLNINAGTLRYGRSNFVSSVGSGTSAPNVNTTTQVNLAAGATLDFGNHYNDAMGSLNGAGTVVLGSLKHGVNLVTSGPSYTYGSTLVINGGNVTNTGTATLNSSFSGNIVSDGLTTSNYWMSGGHLVIGTVTPLVTGAGLQATVTLSGNNTFRGPTSISQGATLYTQGGKALPDDMPVFLNASNIQGPLFELNADEAIGSLGASGSTTLAAFVNPNGHTLTIGGDNLHNEFVTGATGNVIGGIGQIPGLGADQGGTIVKVGTGTQLIVTHQSGGQQSTYTGKYVIKGGTLGFQSDRSVGAAPLSLVPDYFTIDGGTLRQSFLLSGGSQWNANRGVTVTDNGGGLFNQQGGANNWDFYAPITSAAGSTGAGTLTKGGPGLLRLFGDNSGLKQSWKIVDGVVNAGGARGTLVGLGDGPLGTGSIELAQSLMQLTTDFVSDTTDQTMNVASAGAFSYTNGAVLNLNKGNNVPVDPDPVLYNKSLQVTVGEPASAAGTAFVRKAGGNGSLLLLAQSGAASLGTANGELLKVNGGVNTVPVNAGDSVVPTVIISTNNVINTDPAVAGTLHQGEGFFATYDNAVGFKTANMSPKTDINTATSADLYAAVAANTNTLSANASVYGLKVGAAGAAAGVDLNGRTLNVGGATASDPATVIMGMGTTISGGTLTFGAHEGVVYAELATGTTPPAAASLGGTVLGSGGFTKMGYGQLSLDPGAVLNYTGPTRIHQGALVVNADNQLPVNTDLILAGADRTTAFGRAPALFVNDKIVTVNSLNSPNDKVYNNTSGVATVYLGMSGTLKITGSGESRFNGLIASTTSNSAITAAGTTSTVWMAGPGKLTLGLGENAFGPNARETFNVYGKLWVTDGGTVAIAPNAHFNNASTSLPIGQTAVLADAIKLDGGTLRIEGLGAANIGGNTTAIPITETLNSSKGVMLGANGGTIDVEDPYMAASLGGAGSIFSGTGTLTKTGPGMLHISGPDAVTTQNVDNAQWKLVVKEGLVTFLTAGSAGTYVDRTFGAAPATLDPTNITLDGGGIDASGARILVLGATRGIHITNSGGYLSTSRAAMYFNGPLSGTGPLLITGSTPVNQTRFNSSSDGSAPGATSGYFGTVTIARSGAVYANAKNALGTGTITNDPTWPVSFGTDNITAPVQLDNPIVVNKGSTFDFVTNGDASNLILNGQISGDADLYKGITPVAFTSAGTLELNNATNSFTGTFTVSQGTLIPRVDGALSTTAKPVVVLGSGSLGFKGNVNYAQAKPVFVGGTGGIKNVADDNTFAGPITLLGPTPITAGVGSLTLTGDIVGGPGSALTTSGALTVKNIRTDGLTVSAGITKVAAQSDPSNVASYAGTSKVGALTVAPGAAIDLTNNKLITTNPVGTWNGSAYTEVSGLVRDGRNSGAWNGTGIITTDPQAQSSNRVTIGVAKVGSIKGIADGATATFSGQVVLGSDTVAMVTYGGDATLDGKINIDDYGRIDANVASSGSVFGWYNGDFNYDGAINIDDYGIIDGNISSQGAPFATSGAAVTASASLEGVAAVPEPASLGILALGALATLSRRHRRI